MDGSGYTMYLTGGTLDDPTGIFVVDSNGTQVYPQIIDRYGNYWSADANNNLVDDTGRTPVIVTVNGTVTYYDVLAPNGQHYTYNGVQDTNFRLRYTVTTAPIQVQTNFAQQDVYEWQWWVDDTYLYPVQSIALPDGSQYQFSYDYAGELSNVTLPTGGVVQYGYGNFVDSSNTANRWLTSRTVGNNSAMTFTQSVITSCTNYSSGCLEQVNVQKPSGDDVAYDLTINNGAWNTGITTFTGSAPAIPVVIHHGGPIIAYSYSANTYTNACDTFAQCSGANYLSSSLSTMVLFPSSSASSGLYAYKQTQSFYNNAGEKPTDVKEWDYVTQSATPNPTSAPTSTPTREILYTYIGNDVQTIQVLGSAGNQAGLTTYGYTSSATATSGVTGHGTQNAGGPYLQSVSHWLNTSPSTPSTVTYSMDDTGAPIGVTDPNGNTSTMSYQCSNSLAFQANNALNQVSRYSYDCSSGAILSVQDQNDLANGRAGTVSAYESTMGRLQSVSTADGGLTTYMYPSTTEVDTTVAAAPDPKIVSASISDAFGRLSASVTSGVETDTTYDVNGRASCTSNPYLQGTSTTGNTCISSYDGLDRPLTQTLPDSNTRGWMYSANTTTSTNETGATWTRTVDGFNRLVLVLEPGPNGTLQTGYSYDGLGNVSVIDQYGYPANLETPRIRTFTYDSMSRLLAATSPESGTIGYAYDANSNLLTKTDARNITTTYSYDTLNRLTQKAYSDNTLSAYFIYDLATNGNFPASNPIGRLTEVSNGNNATTQYSYDAMGRVNLQGNTLPNGCCVSTANEVSATYDLAGNATDLFYPDGSHVKQTFDLAGRIATSNLVGSDGVTVLQNYLQSMSYNPDSSPNVMTLGNGVQQTVAENNRLQVQSMYASASSASSPFANQNFLSHAYSYTVSGVANNGNIQQITDTLNSTNTQNFTYDALNRINTFSLGGSLHPQYGQYQIDSFGNMSLMAAGTPISTFDPATNRINNLPCASSLNPYDNAGNQLCDTNSDGAIRQYSFDAESRIGSIAVLGSGTPFVNYIYGADGARVHKSNADGTFTEYVNFGGQTLAEKDQTGAWTDYVFAGGKRIAKIPPFDHRVRLSGTETQQGFEWGIGGITPSEPITIQANDQLCWQQYNSNAVGGLSIDVSSGIVAAWQTPAEDGQQINQDYNQGGWQNRCLNMNNFVGQTLNSIQLLRDVNSPLGNFNILFADISYLRANGGVVSFMGSLSTGVIYQGSHSPTDSSLSIVVEDVPWNDDPVVTANSGPYIRPAHFYLADHLGTAQTEFSSGGWPLWQGHFAPFGQELDTQATANHYKFTGLERDSESNLDHAQYRQLAFSQGRWMSSDPYDGSINLASPQSLNRYGYVSNMPLTFVDPTGQDGCSVAAGAGLATGGVGEGIAVGVCAIEVGELIKDFVDVVEAYLYHPKFTGSTSSRPTAIWDEHGGFHATPNSGIGDLLGLPNAGCEFGACGGGGFGFQNAGTMAAPVAIPTIAELIAACVAAEPCPLIVGAVAAIGGTGVLLSQHGSGNKADTGVMQDVYRLYPNLPVCQALDLLEAAARGNTKRLAAINATKKAYGCKRSRASR